MGTPSKKCLQHQSKYANSISKGSFLQLKQHFIIRPNTIGIVQNAIYKKMRGQNNLFCFNSGPIK